MKAKVINGPQQIKGKTGKVIHSVEQEDGKLYTLEFADGLRVDAHQDDLEFIIGEEINKFAEQVPYYRSGQKKSIWNH